MSRAGGLSLLDWFICCEGSLSDYAGWILLTSIDGKEIIYEVYKMSGRIIKVSKENTAYQLFEVLKRNRYKRHKHQAFFVEGVRHINEAVKQGWSCESLIYSGDKQLSDWASNLLEQVDAKGLYELSQPLMDKLSEKTDTSELLAIFSMKLDDTSRIQPKEQPLVVVMDRPSNKGNLGTLIRSCDAFGVDGLIMTGHAVDLYDPETVASSVGTFFSLPVIRLPSYKEVQIYLDQLRNDFPALQVIGTSAKGELYINHCEYKRPTMLLIGNETLGLSDNFKNMCDQLVKIPMGGTASSLNVSCAASIALYEISRQRHWE